MEYDVEGRYRGLNHGPWVLLKSASLIFLKVFCFLSRTRTGTALKQ